MQVKSLVISSFRLQRQRKLGARHSVQREQSVVRSIFFCIESVDFIKQNWEVTVEQKKHTIDRPVAYRERLVLTTAGHLSYNANDAAIGQQ